MSRRFPVKVGDVLGKRTVVKGPRVSEDAVGEAVS